MPTRPQAYFDTGVLVTLYCPEADSPKAAAVASELLTPWAFTAWQRLEMRTALWLKVFRKEMTRPHLHTVWQRVEEDIASGLLLPTAIDHDAALALAEELSARHTAQVGCRTVDIIHVAAAKLLNIEDFVSFDKRQAALARQVGLRVR